MQILCERWLVVFLRVIRGLAQQHERAHDGAFERQGHKNVNMKRVDKILLTITVKFLGNIRET